jgi:hypothetical protein
MAKKRQRDFPKSPTSWMGCNSTLYVSIPFTWHLPALRKKFNNVDMFINRIVVGGPAIKLMPHYFDDMASVTIGDHYPGAMQRVSPWATKTSTGCIRHCSFCAVPLTEGPLIEFDDWPDLPVITDNNLLATSLAHFDKAMDRLERHRDVDFNQGLDSRLLTPYHAERIARLKLAKRGARLALDSSRDYSQSSWATALSRLLSAGIAKRNISSYAIIGFDSDPSEAWKRCTAIEECGIRALPMWFHELDAMKANVVTEKQAALGWSDYERRRIMQWFYQHKKASR